MIHLITTEVAPCPLPGFESDCLRHLDGLFRELPPGTAGLRIARLPGNPDYPKPYFEISPRNLKAAPLCGVVVESDLELTVGKVASREFYGFARGGTILPGVSWQDELRWIWGAVVAGGFTEHIYRNSRGQTVGWTANLVVNGTQILFRNGRRGRIWPFLTKPEEESITYEAYT